MKKLLPIIYMIIFMCSCNQTTRVFDSEIQSIRDQTEEIKRGNDIQEHRNRLIEAQNDILRNKSKADHPNIQ